MSWAAPPPPRAQGASARGLAWRPPLHSTPCNGGVGGGQECSRDPASRAFRGACLMAVFCEHARSRGLSSKEKTWGVTPSSRGLF